MKTVRLAAPVLAAVGLLTGCGPAKLQDPIEIQPNETAWAIPLDSTSQSVQVKFNSVEFLNQKKVAAKRIMVDKVQRSTGRMWWDYEWIPAIKVIKVDRSLVTREWTDASGTGIAANRDGIGVVTKDSVQLRVGLTITASIDEDDASAYLYYHGERKLADVMNQNVRSYAVAELTQKYAEMTLAEAQTNSTRIYNDLFTDAKKTFKDKGITVQYLGNSEGLTYADPAVQTAINKSYTAQQETKTAQMEQNAQIIKNQTTIMTAQATADAAAKLFQVKEASSLQNELKIAQIEADAKLAMAQKWDGKLPENILPSDSQFLFNIGPTKKK